MTVTDYAIVYELDVRPWRRARRARRAAAFLGGFGLFLVTARPPALPRAGPGAWAAGPE